MLGVVERPRVAPVRGGERETGDLLHVDAFVGVAGHEQAERTALRGRERRAVELVHDERVGDLRDRHADREVRILRRDVEEARSRTLARERAQGREPNGAAGATGHEPRDVVDLRVRGETREILAAKRERGRAQPGEFESRSVHGCGSREARPVGYAARRTSIQRMKAIRLVLFGFLLLLAGGTILAQFQRADWACERSLVVPAPQERVHAWLDDVTHWPTILAGPATENAPPLNPTFGATTRGAGAELHAKAPQGSWTLELRASDPAQGLDYRVEFEGGSNTIDGTVRFAPEAGGTRVTLHEGGDVGWGPIERFLRGMIEKGHAEELGRRLERLTRALAEPETSPAPAPPAEKQG